MAKKPGIQVSIELTVLEMIQNTMKMVREEFDQYDDPITSEDLEEIFSLVILNIESEKEMVSRNLGDTYHEISKESQV